MAIPRFGLTKTFAAAFALGSLPAAALAQTAPVAQLSSFTQVYPTYRQEVRPVAFIPQRTFTVREVPVGRLNQIVDVDGSVAHIMPTRQSARAAVMPGFPFSNPYNGKPLLYHGGSIQHSPKQVLILWGFGTCKSTCSNDPYGTVPYLYTFLKEVGGAPYFNSTTQYYEKVGKSVTHVTNPSNTLYSYIIDNNPAPAHPTGPQVAKQAQGVQAFLKLSNNRDFNYVVALGYHHDPSGFLSGQYCAYHTTYGTTANYQPYTVFPYVAEVGKACYADTVDGSDDGVTITLGHEAGETITDPGLAAWTDAQGYENGDKCNYVF
ncbi:MAG: hypothetical protein GIW94_14690 [Candidatus Eremiobacteraeota bacterium]|nr:hypothetical protein [Candidatus Eremiobacteraeota bacterium]MBC5820524.1 hypothetical protein [Candidatus Eremiobacteraeota bacterium]